MKESTASMNWSGEVRTPGQIEDYIIYKSIKEGLDPITVLAIAKCESGLRGNAVGDRGNSFGVFQIHLPAHPSVIREDALDPLFNIRWSLDKMVEGKWKMWSCWSKLFDLVGYAKLTFIY